MEPCPPTGATTECCIVAVPNTSDWQVVCPTVENYTPGVSVPAVSGLGLGLVIVGVALIGLLKSRA